MSGLLISDAELEARVLRSPLVTRDIAALAQEVADEGRSLAQLRAFETGQYAATIAVPLEPGPRRVARAAGREPVPLLPVWLEHGTGIFGPERRMIVAKTPRGMIFPVKGSRAAAGLPARRNGGWVRTMAVKGRPASHVMRDAGRAVAARHGLRFVERST